MKISLPSRYEDLDEAYRGRLVPNRSLLDVVNKAHKSMEISGGIRFLPVYGESGAGKSCAAREISTHLPDVKTFELDRNQIESKTELLDKVMLEKGKNKEKILVAIIDQYEENVAEREKIPTQFVENISLLDRNELKDISIIFIWLTTSRAFQKLLVEATTRNRRMLLAADYTIVGPDKSEWPKIIEETFSFHNNESTLADHEVLPQDIAEMALECKTIGAVIEKVGIQLAEHVEDLQNLSEYTVVLMWPVADSLRNQRVMQFAKPRQGYKLNWEAWMGELNEEDRRQLPLKEFNRARLYFDMRVIPVRVADLHRLCLNLDQEEMNIGKTYIHRFQQTHFYHVVSDGWKEYDYNPVRERESQRSMEAAQWYMSVNEKPTQIGKRLARVFQKCGFEASYEEDIQSDYSKVRADIFIKRKTDAKKNKVIIELKTFSSDNTMPSTIKDAIKVTLRRHAQFAGFLSRS